MFTRRSFVKIAGIGALASALPAHEANSLTETKIVEGFNLGIAGYTFLYYKNNIEKICEVMNQVGVKNISLKNFQLPYDSSKVQADEVIGKFKSAGINVYGLGVIYLKTEQEVDTAMNYAQAAGVKMIIAAPVYEVLPYLEKQAKAFNIRVAIHNHGPEDKLFPDIDAVFEKIKNLDPIIGICLDIGHSFRCGNDPAVMLLKYKERIHDLHIKDVNEPIQSGKTEIMGRGKIDFVSFVKALKKSGYTGICSLEYEQDKDPAMGVAECVGYFNGVLTSVQ
jgi:inosose dehydratase